MDQATGPQTIADYTVWNQVNTMPWEHPRYIDQQHANDMETLADVNTAREVQQLNSKCAFHAIHSCLVTEKRMLSLEDNNLYLKKWYEMCTDLFKSMDWDPLEASDVMDDTIINAWCHAEMVLNEEEYSFSTNAIYERITETKPNTSTPDSRSKFNTFTNAYNNSMLNRASAPQTVFQRHRISFSYSTLVNP